MASIQAVPTFLSEFVAAKYLRVEEGIAEQWAMGSVVGVHVAVRVGFFKSL
jgi:hypothetical protein